MRFAIRRVFDRLRVTPWLLIVAGVFALAFFSAARVLVVIASLVAWILILNGAYHLMLIIRKLVIGLALLPVRAVKTVIAIV